MKPRVLCITGPTACGKTAVSLALQQHLPIEIICMDSMQVYARMDIGTAKPTLEERQAVPHHMLDVVHPEDAFSVAEYRRQAEKVIEDILSRNHVPVLVGGTGMYLRALSLPMTYGGVPGDEQIRQTYENLARTKGNLAVHDLLKQRDPITADRLHPNDVRRVVRALEVQEITGVPLSAQQMPRYEDGPYRILPFGVAWERPLLYDRINQRVGSMVEGGLAQEVKELLQSGVSPSAQSMQGIGYKEMVPHVQGEVSLDEAADAIRQHTRNYAKRQLTWFNADERMVWLPGPYGAERLAQTIHKHYLEDRHAHF